MSAGWTHAEEPGRLLGGRYRLVAELGRGGMGVVHRAVDERTGREVALKLVPKASVAEWQRLVREGRALATLEHPNIVAVLDAGEAGDQAFLAMTLVAGRSMAERLRAGPLPIAGACRLTEGVAQALAHAHAHGVLHRDVKPANVLLEQDGTPRLCDFGLARQQGDGRMTATGEIIGTPSFMAPEQAQGELGAAGPWTDSWGLGGLLYAGLTACPPFEASSVLGTIMQVLERAPAPPSSLRPDVPAAVEALCLRCLDKDPARRPTALQVADALAGLRVAAGRARRRATRVAPRRSGRPLVIGAGALAGLALVVALAALARGPRQDDAPSAAAVSTLAVGEPAARAPAAPATPEQREAARDAWLEQARQHLDARELAPAAAALRQAIEALPARTPRLRQVVSRFGVLLVDHADDATAVRLVDEALGATPLAAEAWVAAADRHGSFGQFAAARRASDRALALAPPRSPTRAWALNHGGMWNTDPDAAGAAANRAAEEALESSPGDLEALFVLGEFRLAAPQHEREHLDRVARGDDPALAARALRSIGVVLFDLEAAARACERDPSSAMAWAGHGYVLGSRGKHREALASLDRALTLDPADIGSLKHRGVLRLQVDDARGAVDDLDRLLRLWPDNGDGYFWRARAAANQRAGRTDAAIADLERAQMDGNERAQARADLVTLRGSRPAAEALPAGVPTNVRIAQADLLRERGDLEGARRELETLLASSPELSLARGALALVLELEGDHTGARAAAARCTTPTGHQALALVLLRDPASIAAADAAVAARPDHHLAWLARALIRRSLGDRQGAAPDVSAGLASAPPSGWSRGLLEAIHAWTRGP